MRYASMATNETLEFFILLVTAISKNVMRAIAIMPAMHFPIM